MATIHYDIGGLRVSVRSRIEELRPVLETLFPRWSGEDDGSSPIHLDIAADGDGFSLNGVGEPYHTPSSDTLIPALEVRIRALYLARAGESLPLHSSGFLNAKGEAVLILGPSGAGKTTLLLKALVAGSHGLSDDLHLWDPVTGVVTAYPRAYSVREGTFDAFPDLTWMAAGVRPSRWNHQRLWYIHPGRSATFSPPRPVKLAALVLLSHTPGDDSLQLVPQWQRLSALLPHIWADEMVLLDGQIPTILRALTKIPVWRGTAEATLRTFLSDSNGAGPVCSAAASHRDQEAIV